MSEECSATTVINTMGELGGDEINVNKRPSLMQNFVVTN